jgi:RND family efflux transporter MFP subunit
MSDTPRRKQGVPTLTSIGYTGNLPGKILKPTRADEPGLSTQQGFAPLSAEEIEGGEAGAAGRARPGAGGTLPMPMMESLRVRNPTQTPLERPRIQMPPLEPPRPEPAAAGSPPQPVARAPVQIPVPQQAPRAPMRARPIAAPEGRPPASEERSRIQVPITPEEAKTTVWQASAGRAANPSNAADISTDELRPLRRMRRWWFLLPIAPLTFVFAYLVFGAPEPEPKPGSLTEAAGNVPLDRSVVIERGTIDVRLRVDGRVLGGVGTEVRSEVAGAVASLHVKDGQTVKEGDPLLTFDSASLRKQLRSASQAITDRKAELHVQRLRRDTVRRDMNSGLLWPAEMEAAEAEVERAEGRLKAAIAGRRRLEERGRASSLTAPSSGVVRDLAVNVGDRLAPGRDGAAPALMVIQEPGKLAIEADLSPEIAAKVAIGGQARVTMQELPGKSLAATITALPEAPLKTPEGSEVYRAELLVEVGADSPEIPVGAPVAVKLPAGKKQGVLLVPVAAVKADNAGATVEVWSPEQRQYQRRVVQTGDSDDTHMEVTSNLSEGERVRLPGKS